MAVNEKMSGPAGKTGRGASARAGPGNGRAGAWSRKRARSGMGGVTGRTAAGRRQEIGAIFWRLGRKLGVSPEQKSGFPRLFAKSNNGNYTEESTGKAVWRPDPGEAGRG